MNLKHALYLLLAVLLAGTCSALAATPAVSPFESDLPGVPERGLIPADKAFGDPSDFMASALAGADYVVGMQADVTEDNAGNGEPDTDPQDGGWDWVSIVFSHSTAPSRTNLYGVTALGLYETYLANPQAAHFTAMKDAADQMVIIGPDPGGIRSADDVVFLLKFANLSACPDPAYYRAGAQAIWDRHLSVYGSMEALAIAIRNLRGGSLPNGIIPWDIGPWVEAAMLMHAAFPGVGHDAEAAAVAEVIYQDSYMGIPGYYEPFGHSQGYDPLWETVDYFYYSLGLSGIIQAFATAGVHTDEIPALQTALLDCQYPDGSFSDQYGAQGGDSDWQDSAYAVASLVKYLPTSPASAGAVQAGAYWLASTQDASGGWVYTSGNHYPEVGGECTAAMALAAGSNFITSAVDGPDPVLCGVTKEVTVSYTPGEPVVGLRGYEITFAVTGPVSFGSGNIHDAGDLAAIGLHQFFRVDNGDGTYTVNDALLGTTAGLQTAADFFTVDLLTTGDGPVSFEILSYKLRDLVNAPMTAFFSGLEFTVDCTAPDPVTGITADPGHEKVDVSWSMADESDVAYYEIWRGLWYDTTPGVSAYPEYDDLAADVIPTRPADRAAAFASDEWEPAGTAPVGTLSFADEEMTSGRGVYYYEVFPVDVPGNIGGPAAANDRATNYWLGDIYLYDGLVETGDIVALGVTFGYDESDFGYNNEADVGRTDDWSAVGIPMTDSVIDFEDLMVFAMNYGNVSKRALPTVGGIPVLAWREVEPQVWSLTLSEPCAALKGVRITADLPAGVSCRLEEGLALVDQKGPVFLRNIDANGLDANLAVFGWGTGIDGSGELLRVHLSEPVDLAAAGIKARGLDNKDLDASRGSVLPTLLRVEPNFPNPFNPSTTILFELPHGGHVVLAVYALDGTLVRTLASGSLPAGRHTVVWDGRDESGSASASGTYFFRMSTGADQVVRKMQLIK